MAKPRGSQPRTSTAQPQIATTTVTASTMPVTDVVKVMQSAGLGFERVEHLTGTSYRDCSTVIVIPSRGMIPVKVVQAWQGLIAPMNQKRAMLYATGDEVGVAYNNMIQNVLGNPELSKWKYVMTLEDDNLPPPDAHIRLLETIEQGNYDAVSGIYFTKGEITRPMAYGDPEEYKRTGVLAFEPRDIRAALTKGQIMEVNGIAMGCSLYRMELFREIPKPWFVTVADIVPGKGVQCFTQDLFFCQEAKRRGKRFCVDLRVRVGHLDVNTGVVY
jgi:hypothetical protein